MRAGVRRRAPRERRHTRRPACDSYAVSALNGLKYDRHQEELNVHTFTGALRAAIEEFHRDPLGPPLVPNWARVWAGLNEAGPQLMRAVAEGPAGAPADGELHQWRNGASPAAERAAV